MAISKSQEFFEKLWYRKANWWLWLFLPFHWLLKLVVWIRRFCYQAGFFRTTKISSPVVVIGNINVGGTGKTPFAIFLLEWLQQQGYRPGLVTRGYGSDSKLHPQKVSDASTVHDVGDEPLLIYKHSNAPIIVDHKRVRGAQLLISEQGCDIVICDDGLQHYALHRDLEILIIDGERQFGNGWLMPFGPLREPVSRAKNCHISIINGSEMKLIPAGFKTVAEDKDTSREDIEEPITAVAAIGNPQRFYNTLIGLQLEFSTKSFPDHYEFSAKDFTDLPSSIMMTEKDAVKCQQFADERFYYVPIKAQIETSKLKQLTELLDSFKRVS